MKVPICEKCGKYCSPSGGTVEYFELPTLQNHEFKLMVEAQNKFLYGLAEKYELKRCLMSIQGRSIGDHAATYLFYEDRIIGKVTQEYRTEGRSYFLDTIFTPNPDAHIICAEVNARKEQEEAFDYFLPKPKGSQIPNFEHKK